MRVTSKILDSLDDMPRFDELTVKNEPMLFNCDMAHAIKLGGPIVQAMIQRIPLGWHDEPLVIDTRVHMLMKGWYPCIPGWHHDDVPRTRSDGQPNYGPGQDRSQHVIALVNGGICPTAFAIGTADFSEVPEGKVCYERWHREVELQLHYQNKLKYLAMGSQSVWIMDDRTWHRGTPARKGGWRWFGRISRYYDTVGNCIPRRNERTNEVRRQVQVYLSDPNKGW